MIHLITFSEIFLPFKVCSKKREKTYFLFENDNFPSLIRQGKVKYLAEQEIIQSKNYYLVLSDVSCFDRSINKKNQFSFR